MFLFSLNNIDAHRFRIVALKTKQRTKMAHN